MAWANTIDERYAGGFISLSADTYDAPNYVNSNFVLSQSAYAYGNLTDAYILADEDVYSLGSLSTGYYTLDVDEYNWDFGSFGYGSVGSFELLGSTGLSLSTSYSVYTDIIFTVNSPSTYYVKIKGSSGFSEAEYRVSYTKTGELIDPNVSTVWGTSASFTGTLVPGSTLDAGITYFDANGNSDNSVGTGWYVNGIYQGLSETLTLTTSDVGKEITFDFSLIDDDGYYEQSPVYTAGTVTVANATATFSNPTFSGSLVSGSTVTTSISYSDPDGNSDGVVLTGWYLDDGNLNNGVDQYLENYTSTNGALVLDASWVGKTLYFTKGFMDDAGNLEVSWDGSSTNGLYRVGEITAANNDTTGAVTLSGTALEGETLTADTSSIDDADGLGPFSYQWRRGDDDISGATGATYVLTAEDIGYGISVRVSYTDGRGTTETTLSARSNPVQLLNNDTTGSPTISGTALEGETLTADTSSIDDADGLGPFSYQWRRGDDDISGATGSSYVLTADDVGYGISVRVSYTDGRGTTETTLSAQSNTVQLLESDTSEKITQIHFDDIYNRADALGLNYSDFELLLEDSEYSDSAYYFAKWGGELGSAPTLSYSFQASGPLQFDAEYYDYYEWEFDLNYTVQDWIDLAAVNPDYQFDEFGAEEIQLFEEALSDWSAVTGIQFVQNDPYVSPYGDLHFNLVSFEMMSTPI